MMNNKPKYGTVEGTGADIVIKTGFYPAYVKVINIDGDCSLEHIRGMSDDEGYKVLTGIDATADTVSIHSQIASDGITLSSYGFTIGADTDVNVEDETLFYIAFPTE